MRFLPRGRVDPGCHETFWTDTPDVAYWNRYVAVTQMHGHGALTSFRCRERAGTWRRTELCLAQRDKNVSHNTSTRFGEASPLLEVALAVRSIDGVV